MDEHIVHLGLPLFMMVVRKEDNRTDEGERSFLPVGDGAGEPAGQAASSLGRTVRWQLKWAQRYRREDSIGQATGRGPRSGKQAMPPRGWRASLCGCGTACSGRGSGGLPDVAMPRAARLAALPPAGLGGGAHFHPVPSASRTAARDPATLGGSWPNSRLRVNPCTPGFASISFPVGFPWPGEDLSLGSPPPAHRLPPSRRFRSTASRRRRMTSASGWPGSRPASIVRSWYRASAQAPRRSAT